MEDLGAVIALGGSTPPAGSGDGAEAELQRDAMTAWLARTFPGPSPAMGCPGPMRCADVVGLVAAMGCANAMGRADTMGCVDAMGCADAVGCAGAMGWADAIFCPVPPAARASWHAPMPWDAPGMRCAGAMGCPDAIRADAMCWAYATDCPRCSDAMGCPGPMGCADATGCPDAMGCADAMGCPDAMGFTDAMGCPGAPMGATFQVLFRSGYLARATRHHRLRRLRLHRLAPGARTERNCLAHMRAWTFGPTSTTHTHPHATNLNKPTP